MYITDITEHSNICPFFHTFIMADGQIRRIYIYTHSNVIFIPSHNGMNPILTGKFRDLTVVGYSPYGSADKTSAP